MCIILVDTSSFYLNYRNRFVFNPNTKPLFFVGTGNETKYVPVTNYYEDYEEDIGNSNELDPYPAETQPNPAMVRGSSSRPINLGLFSYILSVFVVKIVLAN